MPIHQDSFKNNLHFQFNKDLNIAGLDSFKKNLEKDFFSEVTIRHRSSGGTNRSLIIELDCNFGLHEILHYMKNGSWGHMLKNDDTLEESSLFSRSLLQLKELNCFDIDVDEFSIFLNDTSVIINKIYEQSIPEQLEHILTKVAEHYVHLTNGLTEIPFEIYVPVFEEGLLENDTTLANIRTANNSQKDYFNYWGLYFDSEDDAVIYDLAKKTIVPGDLYMLNH
ncbi:MAG: hypothetical protein AAFO99_06120 [Bacteroidota bacterium]